MVLGKIGKVLNKDEGERMKLEIIKGREDILEVSRIAGTEAVREFWEGETGAKKAELGLSVVEVGKKGEGVQDLLDTVLNGGVDEGNGSHRGTQ